MMLSPCSLFHDDSWRDLLEKPEPTRTEIAELVGRVSQYMCLTTSTQLSIAEAMVTYQVSVTRQSEGFVDSIGPMRGLH